MDKLEPQLRSPIERAGWLAADSKMTVLRANWSGGGDADGRRHRWTLYIREASRDSDDKTPAPRSLRDGDNIVGTASISMIPSRVFPGIE